MHLRGTFLAAVASALALWASAVTASPSFVVGSFESGRGGDYSFAKGDAWSDARALLAAHFPGAVLRGISEIDASSVADIDLLILSSPATNGSAIRPLSSAEQDALQAFVRGGGSAIILADNDSFDPNARVANESLLDPFGAAIAGCYCVAGANAVVMAPDASPITRGPFGTVLAFSQGCEGGLTSVGPYGRALATNPIGTALASIDAGALAPASGRVVIFSDVNAFQSASYPGGWFVNVSLNQALFLNAIEFVRPVVIGGFDVSRGGDYSIAFGDAWADARASLVSHFRGARFEAFPELTPDALAGVDVLVLSSPATNGSAIEPLTAAEQEELLRFVRRGKGAILLSDNSEFDLGAPAANQSLLAPLGARAEGVFCMGGPNAHVIDPDASPVTSGPFGAISAFTQGCEGGIVDPGPYGLSIATNPIGDALVDVAPGTLGPGAGRVVIFSDVNSFQSASYPGGWVANYLQNESLFLNSVAACR